MFSIHSTSSDRQLEFSNLRGELFTVVLNSSQLYVAKDISTYTDEFGLLRLFQDLAAQDRPWLAPFSWGSLEGDFKISATCTPLGVVTFQIHLIDQTGAAEMMDLSFSVSSELGQLPRIANAAKSFFHPVCA